MIFSALAVHVKLQRFLHDALQRYMPLSRDAAAILVFRSIIRYGAIHARDLQSYIAPAGRYGDPFSSERLTLFLALPHAQSARFRENQVREFGGVLGSAQDCQQHSRPILLHLHRHAKSVERALLEQTIHYIAEDLRIQIVDIRFEHGNGVRGNRGREFRLCFADREPYDIRMSGKVTRACSVAGLSTFIDGKRREPFCQRFRRSRPRLA